MTAPPAGALEACPFCGGEPRAVYGLLSEVHYVTCDNDGCKTNGPSADSESAAIAAWNRRTHGPALATALRLRESCEGLVGEYRLQAKKLRNEVPNLSDGSDKRFDSARDADTAADDLARVLEQTK